ncbi:MAG: hypothetical protein ACFFDN_49945, partial [Candidatus Hodarchaeota archaeon]
MSKDPKDDDKSIVDALSALGWVEEKEEGIQPQEEEGSIQAQLESFKEQCELLKKEVGNLTTENELLKKKQGELTRENEQLLQMTLKEKKEEEKSNVALN